MATTGGCCRLLVVSRDLIAYTTWGQNSENFKLETTISDQDKENDDPKLLDSNCFKIPTEVL